MTETENNQHHDSELDLWEVFVQQKAGAHHVHAGSVHAADGEMALQNARDLFARRGKATNIWVLPAVQIIASASEDSASFFDPADDKLYRHPSFYEFISVKKTRKKE